MWMMKTTTKPRISVPASSAVLQRDFSTVGRLITCSRSSLSAAYAEMVMLLNGNVNHIPIEVPALSTEQALQAVPRHLSYPKAEVAALSAGEAGFADEAGVGTPPAMSTQRRRSLRAKKALTPATATPQGKARARSLGDE